MTGFEPAPPRHRLAFVLEPEPALAARIVAVGEDLRDAGGLSGPVLPAPRLHLTLHRLGDHAGLPQDLIRAAAAAASAVKMAPFSIAFDRAVSFADKPRNRPVVLSASDEARDLSVFRERLSQQMETAGLAHREGGGFAPHVTLLYDDKALAERPIEPIIWAVESFTLTLTVEGRRTSLRTWPLQA